ncbi:AAA family ATPase, partial [Chloroflexota bacterium]
LVKNVPFKTAEIKIYSIDYDKILTYTLEKTIKTIREEPLFPTDVTRDSIFQMGTSEAPAIQKDQLMRSFQTERDKWKIKPEHKESDGRWRHRYLPTARLYVSPSDFLRRVNRTEGQGLSEERLDIIYSEALQYIWQNYHSNLITQVNKATQDGMANILKPLLSLRPLSKKAKPPMSTKIAYERISKFLKRQGSNKLLGSLADFEKAYRDNPQLQSVVADIDRTEQKITRIMAPQNNLESLIGRMFSGNKTLHFGDRSIDVITDAKENIGIGSLSSGEKHILQIFIETLLSNDCTFLIDEPEISVHIDWQRELIKTMHDLNPSLQLILATHSPEIMADIDESQIYKL